MAYLYRLLDDYVVICIKIYNFKGSKKYDPFMSLIFLRRFTEMGILSIFKSP